MTVKLNKSATYQIIVIKGFQPVVVNVSDVHQSERDRGKVAREGHNNLT